MSKIPPIPHFNALQKDVKDEFLAFAKWLLLSVLVGGAVGVVGVTFHHAITWATATRGHYPWLLYLLPLAGLIIVTLYHVTGMDDDSGTEFVLESVRDAHYMRLRTPLLIFITTTLTHLCGGSAGREGAALQLGGGIANWFGKVLHLRPQDMRVITMAGMAAGFSALFGTPLAASIFAMEVTSVGTMYYAAIVPCFLSALIAKLVAGMLGGEETAFALPLEPQLSALTLVQVLALGALCGLVAILFCFSIRYAGVLYGTLTKNRWVRATLGGVLIIVLSLAFGRDYNGAGMGIIEAAVAGTAVPWAFLLKILFTALTLTAGFKGGEIVPSFFVGATFGCTVAPLLGMDPGFGAAIGMVAVFCGVTNCPMASILLGYELFGGQGMALLALSCAVSYMLSGYVSLYHKQKVVYSKTETTFVNRMIE